MTNAEDSRRYERSGSVILIEAKLQRSPESVRGGARLSISD